MIHYTYNEGDAVTVDMLNIKFHGIIRGVSSLPAAVIGAMYIIEIVPTIDSTIDLTVYPYSCVVAAECNIIRR